MNPHSRVGTTTIGTWILEFRICVIVVTFGQTNLLQLKITINFWFPIRLILMFGLERRVLLIHLDGRIVLLVGPMRIRMIKFWALKSFGWGLHYRGWFYPSLIPLIFIGGITLFNIFLYYLCIESRKLHHHILWNHGWRRTHIIVLVSRISKSLVWGLKIIARHLSCRIVHTIRETSLQRR